jgi:serine/threonine-protein kinase
MSNFILNVDEVIGSNESAYVIEGELGRGASGIVYKARSVGRPDELVALKLIEGFMNLDTQLVEPEILSRLKHPNIVRLVDYFLDSGKLAIAMEYINGPNLDGWSESHGRHSSAEVRDFLRQMAESLACAHAQGVIHRDIKPGNILVAKDKDNVRYVLADFGVSRKVEGIQVSKQLAGSYRFMAPEQIRGRATPQSDLWSLGVVAYWLLTDRFPFNGSTIRELSDQIAVMSPAALGTMVQDVDADLETIILKLLQKDPIRRIDSAASLQGLLTEYAPSKPLRASDRGAAVPPWEAKIDRAIARRKVLFWIFLILWMIHGLFFGPALVALGVYNVYLHQARLRGVGHMILGLFLIPLGLLTNWVTGIIKLIVLASVLIGPRVTSVDIQTISSINLAVVWCTGIITSLLWAYNCAKWRLLKREMNRTAPKRFLGPQVGKSFSNTAASGPRTMCSETSDKYWRTSKVPSGTISSVCGSVKCPRASNTTSQEAVSSG